MNCYGIEVAPRHIPALDPNYAPLGLFNRAFLKTARKPLGLAVERSNGQVAVCETFIHGTPDMAEADRYYVDRLVKTLLWMKGGFRVYVRGDETVYETLKAAYTAEGSRAFDADFMARVYERPFEVVSCEKLPEDDRQIFVQVLLEEDVLFYSVRNRSLPVNVQPGQLPVTTKIPPALHGYGLQNVQTTLRKYHSLYALNYADGWFGFATDLPNSYISTK